MLDVSSNGIINLNRGDAFSLDVTINIGTIIEPIIYLMKNKDKLYFALMEPNEPFEQALMRRMFTEADQDSSGNVLMKFPAEQTEYIMPGTYYYTVKLVRQDTDEDEPLVDTIIPKTKFVIIE